MKNSYCYTCLLLLLISLQAFSADYSNYRYLNGSNGFIDQPVYSIIRSNDNFIWTATKLGVYKYDGLNLKHYLLTQSDILVDDDGREITLYKDSAGTIWAFTDSGKIFYYDAGTDSFVRETDINILAPGILLNDIYIDQTDKMWIASSMGIYMYDLYEKRFISNRTFLYGIWINRFERLPDQTLAVATRQGVWFADIHKGLKDTPVVCADKDVLNLCYDPDTHGLWMGCFSAGFFRYDIDTYKVSSYTETDDILQLPIRSIINYDSTAVLLGVDGKGVYRVEKETLQTSLLYTDDDTQKGILSGNGVYSLLIDEGNLWVGSYSGGITIIGKPNEFEIISHLPYSPHSLRHNHVNDIIEDKVGNLWYATNSGISMWEKSSRKWKHYFDNDIVFLTLMEDCYGRIWCGSYGWGTYIINMHSGEVKHVHSWGKAVQPDCIYSIFTDPEGGVWVGGLNFDLTYIAPENLPVCEPTRSYQIFPVNSISSINRDSLFIATTNGFYLLDRQKELFRHVFNYPSEYGVQSRSFIYTGLILDREIYFGTDGGGLNVFNPDTWQVTNYSTATGLPSNYIYAIVQADDGLLWLSTNNGLFSFDPVRKEVVTMVDKAMGLPSQEFVMTSYCKLKDGRLAFGTNKGAVLFDSHRVQPFHLPESLKFTDFNLFYKSIKPAYNPEILIAPVDEISGIRLSHNQNSFSFEYIVDDLYHPERYYYLYKLEGFDEEWLPETNRTTAEYTNIPPGQYLFNVRALEKGSNRMLTERNIKVFIAQPWWNTGWAWMVYILIILIISWILYRYISERVRLKQSADKIRFFMNIAHDIRTPLSLVLAPLEDLKNEEQLSARGDRFLHTARQNGEKLLAIVNQLLFLEKVDKKRMVRLVLTRFDLNHFLQHTVQSFSPAIRKKNIHFSLQLPDEPLLLITDQDKLQRIVDNLISNAVKYTRQEGEIQLTVRVDTKQLLLTVADNGLGISPKEQKKIFRQYFRAENAINSNETGTGVGLILTYELVKLLKGKITFNSEAGKGTTFSLILPLSIEGEFNEKHISEEKEKESFVQPAPVNSGEVYTKKEEACKLLIVEDNHEMREYLTYSLNPVYQVHAVPSAEEALEYLKLGTADIIISDVMMPGMDGDEMCRLIKTNVETSHMLVILLTARTGREQILKGLECGADDYIIKPADINILKAKISNLLHTRKKIQHYYYATFELEQKHKEIEEKENKQSLPTNTLDDRFIQDCISYVTKNIEKEDLKIEDMCKEVAMSRSLVYKKLIKLTGHSPNDFIKNIRLRYAYELLQTGNYPVADVALKCGFSDAKYFSTVFKKHFGCSPSAVFKMKNEESGYT